MSTSKILQKSMMFLFWLGKGRIEEMRRSCECVGKQFMFFINAVLHIF